MSIKMSWDLVIESEKSVKKYWKELWHYRELFYFLAWRDIKVQYKQTVIGLLWAVLRPFLSMIVFTIIFGKIAKLPSNGVPYAVLVFSGMLPWQLFATALQSSSNSVVGSSHLISKVYFPRIIIPASAIVTSLVDFSCSFVMLLGVMLYYGFMPSVEILLLPLFVLPALMASLGAGLWFSSLIVKYRDFRYVVPFVVQFGMYLSPVGFSSAVVPEKWRFLYSLNPMAGVIDGFRWSICGTLSNTYIPGLILSQILTMILCITGFWFFRKTERKFADEI